MIYRGYEILRTVTKGYCVMLGSNTVKTGLLTQDGAMEWIDKEKKRIAQGRVDS